MSYFESLLNTYIENEWDHTVIEDKQIIFMRVQTNISECTLVTTSDEEQGFIHAFVRLAQYCPLEKRKNATHLINRLNFLINMGTWILDEQDGETRFRIIQAYLKPPTTQEIELLLSLVFSGHDSFADELRNYFEGNTNFEETLIALNGLFGSAAD